MPTPTAYLKRYKMFETLSLANVAGKNIVPLAIRHSRTKMNQAGYSPNPFDELL